MHYFIDGYNLFFRLPEKKRSLEEGRDLLIDSLVGVKLSLSIVFDGGGSDEPRRTHKGPLEIVYTAHGQSADSYILEEVSWVKNPQDYTVVTSDKQLAKRCQMAGSKSQSIAAFLALIEKKQRVSTKEKPSCESPKNIDKLLKIFTDLLKKYENS